MKAVCDLVVEHVALDQPLGELAGHVKTCARCRRLVEMPKQLAVSFSRSAHAADPGLGFAARMTVAAQQRIAVRHRRRIAGGLAAAVAAGVIGVFVMTRSPDKSDGDARPAIAPIAADTEQQRPVAVDATDLDLLVNLADTKRARRASAQWGRIQRPLKPYMKLVKGVER